VRHRQPLEARSRPKARVNQQKAHTPRQIAGPVKETAQGGFLDLQGDGQSCAAHRKGFGGAPLGSNVRPILELVQGGQIAQDRILGGAQESEGA